MIEKSQEKSGKDKLTLKPCPFCGVSLELGPDNTLWHPVFEDEEGIDLDICILDDFRFPNIEEYRNQWDSRVIG